VDVVLGENSFEAMVRDERMPCLVL
jgi:hypothetical protein